ncbi:MAG: family 16 glycosylhydrolase [Bacteroidota bacterium]
MNPIHFISVRRAGLVAVLLFLSSTAMVSLAQENTAFTPGDLIWSDEFEGTGIPDPANWERLEYNRRNNPNGPDGWWSNEDSYLDGEGHLVIRVRRIDDKNADGDSCDFSTGMVRSHGLFEQKYGKFEASCLLPTQPGWWVAFWMMQGNVSSTANAGIDGSEVDIMEGFGWTNKINQAIHWDGYGSAHKSVSKATTVTGIREGYHTYTLEWYPGIYIFYIDGTETWRSTGGGVCKYLGYIKLTGELSTEDWAINNYWANHPKDAVYPDSFLVDYVRVYELDESLYPITGTGGLEQAAHIRLFPNPARDLVTVSWDPDCFNGNAMISLFNPAGQLLREEKAVENGFNLPTGDLPSGIYLLRMQMDERQGFMKLVKD